MDVKDLLKLDDNEKIECFLQAFEYSGYFNKIKFLDNGKIKLTSEDSDRPRYYKKRGLVRLFNKAVREGFWENLFEAIEERQNGTYKKSYLKDNFNDSNCPYCSGENIDFVDSDNDSIKYVCQDCGEDFICWKDGSITTRNGRTIRG